MNLYEKMNIVKTKFLEANVKKSGENKFAGFKYYELSDIIPTLIKLCDEVKLFTKISFNNELATLTIVNIEKVEETIEYTSPMRELELKGCNSIQALGGTETYQRRYLYLTAFDIIENDMFDAKSGTTDNEEKLATSKQVDYIVEHATTSQVKKILDKFKIESLDNLTIEQADITIKNIKDVLSRGEN